MSSPKQDQLPDEDVKYEIPILGSLGLLALGYKGVQAWRAVRDQKLAEQNEKQSDEHNVSNAAADDSKRNP